MSEFVGEAWVRLRYDTHGADEQLKKDIAAQTKGAEESTAATLGATAATNGQAAANKAAAASGLTLVQVDEQLLELERLRATSSKGLADQLDAQIAGLRTHRAALLQQADGFKEADRSSGALTAGFGRARIAGIRLRSTIGTFGALAGGLVIAAQGASQLSDALHVDGEEAYTTEGRLRNLGSQLLHGDFVGGIIELHRTSDRFSLARILEEADVTSEGLRTFAEDADAAATSTEDASQRTQKAAGRFGGGPVFIRNQEDVADSLRSTAESARAVANEMDRAAGSTDAFSRAAANAANAQPLVGADVGALSSAGATRNSIAETVADRTRSLKDNLQVARDERGQAERIYNAYKDQTEGYLDRLHDFQQARTNVIRIEQQIEDQALAAARAAEAERKRRAAEAERLRAERLRAAEQERRRLHDAYTGELDFQEALLELGIRRAELTEKTLTDDRNRERKLIAFYRRASQDRQLTKEERRRYFLALQNEKIDLESLRPETSSGGGFTLNELFQESVNQFNEFASNVSGGGMTPGSARGAVAGGILAQRPQDRTDVIGRVIATKADAQLNAAATTNDLLRGILRTVRGSGPGTEYDPGTKGAATAADARYLGHHLVGT